MPEPYDPQDAISILRSILKNDGDLKIRDHCYRQMGKRSYDDLDIYKVLEENGVVHSKPQFDQQHQKWKYLVDGYCTEGEKMQVVVNISEENWRVVAISVIDRWTEEKRK